MKLTTTLARTGFSIALLMVAFDASLAGDEPLASDDEAVVRICDAYGPGYQVVPGTRTCIKVSGSVEVDANSSGGQQPK